MDTTSANSDEKKLASDDVEVVLGRLNPETNNELIERSLHSEEAAPQPSHHLPVEI